MAWAATIGADTTRADRKKAMLQAARRSALPTETSDGKGEAEDYRSTRPRARCARTGKSQKIYETIPGEATVLDVSPWAQVSSGLVESNGQPFDSTKRSHAPAICEVTTAVMTKVV